MYQPWHTIPPDWDVCLAELPDDLAGEVHYDTRTIYLDRHLSQAGRRSVLSHEVAHVLCGDDEHMADEISARQLVPLDDLIRALAWTRDPHELAFELFVIREVIDYRLSHLSPDEQAAISAAIGEDEDEQCS